MGTEIIALTAAATFMAYAIFSASQTALMAAVAAYATVVGWIIQHDLSLLMAALGLAIVLGIAGLGVIVYRELSSQDDTSRHAPRKLRTNNRALANNIGS